jgi:hypothetical protein
LIAYLFHVPLLALLAYGLYRQYGNGPLQKYFFPALALKLTAGVVLGLLYTYHYTYGGDTFLFHREASAVADWARTRPFAYLHFLGSDVLPDATTAARVSTLSQPRALVMVKLVSILHLLTGNNYWLSGAWLSLFSFWGLWRLVYCLAVSFPATRRAAAVGFLFFPSVVFWSAGIIKETVAAGIIGFAGAFLLGYWRIERLHITWRGIGRALGLVAGLGMLWQLKFYYCAVLVLCGAAGWLAHRATQRFSVRTIAGRVLLFEGVLAVLAGAAFLLPGLSLGGLLAGLVGNHDAHLRAHIADPALVYEGLQPTLGSLAAHAPKALGVGLFRPFLWEAGGPLQAWVGVENALLLVASVLAVAALLRERVRVRPSIMLLLAVLHYIVILGVLLPLAAPNYGEVSRYKVAFLPFFAYLVLAALLPSKADKIDASRRL